MVTTAQFKIKDFRFITKLRIEKNMDESVSINFYTFENNISEQLDKIIVKQLKNKFKIIKKSKFRIGSHACFFPTDFTFEKGN
jgi:hypothetical protein